MDKTLETATLGGGCFWCIEAALRLLNGVVRVVSGYAGGHVDQPTYHEVSAGSSGHAEVVQVEFDPSIIDYRTLLTAFFAIHDPTTPNRQGHDIGTQYRSVIYFHGVEQERSARELIAELEAQRTWANPVVTAVQPAPTFWPAEDYHQDYFAHHPSQGYCQAVVAPKVAKLRQRFAAHLKTGV
jgi:peptide-methionine (S)-S-oxide reductase